MERLKIDLVVQGSNNRYIRGYFALFYFFLQKLEHIPKLKKGDKSSLGKNVRCPLDAH